MIADSALERSLLWGLIIVFLGFKVVSCAPKQVTIVAESTEETPYFVFFDPPDVSLDSKLFLLHELAKPAHILQCVEEVPYLAVW